MTVENLIQRLHGVRKTSNGFDALCPSHEDRNASLSIHQEKDGKILLTCHAGCSFDNILSSLHLEKKDLFPVNGQSYKTKSIEVCAYDYTDENGNLLYQCVRYEPKKFSFRRKDVIGNWIYNLKGVRYVIYNLPRVLEAIKRDETIFIVEGEKDVETLRDVYGLTATCNPMGALKWKDEYSDSLIGATCIIIPDNDETGKKHAEDVARSLHGKAKSVKVVELPDLKEKRDISDWITSNHTKEELETLIANTPEYFYTSKLIPLSNESFHFEIFDGNQICEMNIPEQAYLIKDLLSEQSVNFLSGEEGCGKSLLAMNLGISIAIGASKWLEYEIVKSDKVIYLNNELAFDDFARRLKLMCDRLPARGNISNLIVPKEVPALSECWDSLNELCEREKPCIIIFDCMYLTHDENENDSSAMKKQMRKFLALRDRYKTALLLVHHTKKGSQYQKMHNDQMRGSNVFGAITDTVLQIRRSSNDERMRIFKPTKFRHVSDENRKCRLLSLDAMNLWFKDEGETDEGEHIAQIGIPTAKDVIDFESIFESHEEMSFSDIVNACQDYGYGTRTIRRLIDEALGKQLEKVKHGKYKLIQSDSDTPL